MPGQSPSDGAISNGAISNGATPDEATSNGAKAGAANADEATLNVALAGEANARGPAVCGAMDGGAWLRLRAAWAGVSFAGARAVAGRTIGAAVPARSAEGVWLGDHAALLLEGRLSVDPMSGAVFRDGRPLSWPSSGADASEGGAPGPSDWLVRAFPSRQSFPEIAPLWFGARPDVATALAEALPRRIALDRLAPEAVGLVCTGLGRLDAMQEALGAGVFAPGAIKVQPWDKVIHAPRVVWSAGGVVPADLREAGRRLRAAFGVGPEGAVMLVAGGEARAARIWPDWRGLLARTGARLIDSERTPLAALAPALAGARVLIAPDSGEAALGLVREGPLTLVTGRSERPDGRGAAVAAALGWQASPGLSKDPSG